MNSEDAANQPPRLTLKVHLAFGVWALAVLAIAVLAVDVSRFLPAFELLEVELPGLTLLMMRLGEALHEPVGWLALTAIVATMLNSRNHGVDLFHRGVSISKDGGATFASFRRDPTLLEPRCQASIHRYRWATNDKPGVILFTNPARKWRDFLMMRISHDDGKTWPDARIIYPFTAAYSDIATLPDGRVAVLFERDNNTRIDLAILPAFE